MKAWTGSAWTAEKPVKYWTGSAWVVKLVKYWNGSAWVQKPALTTYATLDGATTNVAMSNGNLTATHTNAVNNSGARSTSLKSSGKFYFEVTCGVTSGFNNMIGILLSTGTYTNLVTTASNCSAYGSGGGNVFSNNINTSRNIGVLAAGDIIGVAIDLDVRKAWFRRNGGLWNGQAIGTENPATGVGTAVIAAGSFAPTLGFGGSGGPQTGDNMTANFGAAAFSGAVPSGFTSGWPA